MSGYCDIAPSDPWHAPYHEREYGFPLADDRALFERLVLEIMQAGLSWHLILKRRDSFRAAFEDFDLQRVAAYGARERQRLLADPGVIRNRLKIDAVIDNAQRIIDLRDQFGSFDAWLAHHHPADKADWVKLFRKTFRFTGPEIVGEFLMSIGYLPGAHRPTCPVYQRIVALEPPWMRDQEARPAPRKPATKMPAHEKPATKKTAAKKAASKAQGRKKTARPGGLARKKR
jgi:DNA-3-methyladenine glycosylase I